MAPAKVSLRGFVLDGYKCTCGEETFNPCDIERVRLALH